MPSVLLVSALVLALSGCLPQANTTKAASFVGVMIDNHEDARPYQRGLEQAVFVQEHLVEGFITRFEAVFDTSNLPESVGPVRSVRPYFLDGSSPIISAIFHVGGSPEALEKLESGSGVTSFNALAGFNRSYDEDRAAPAPHHRFITRDSVESLLSTTALRPVPTPLFPLAEAMTGAPARTISIDYHSPLHTVTYAYDEKTQLYEKESAGLARPPSPRNLIVIETDVAVVGPYGRLRVRTTGSGAALFFRDGLVERGTWSKPADGQFYAFTNDQRQPFLFADGQVWMIVLDSLDRVAWED